MFKFHIAHTSGALVPGSYGHVSVYDSVARRILVHGGYSAVLPSHHELSDLLYSYDPKHRTWYVPIIISRVMYYGTPSTCSTPCVRLMLNGFVNLRRTVTASPTFTVDLSN